ncbi:hypothetical protein J5N97_005751 [Dioscorea zingiberensis]|uniref:Gfo/Idh/MocA-like oxidoreductase N-terminal domain-containing protein n=1 Tax=Dioscorea zingiberensis TaxID=325984 RepID=A0A9D5D8P8_9LILI|nr:hypothetical protein J5N97_005751 [Dioscorea zingiberensis]
MAEQAPIVRFGIMGCANIAIKVSRAIGLAPNATVVAVASRNVNKALDFISAHGLPEGTRAYGSYEEILEDEGVDAMYVPLPTSLHLKWAVATVEKRKHLLLEKPVALCVADLDRILEACEVNGVQYMDATMWMHHPRTAKMKELLSDPSRFGQLQSIHSAFSYRGDAKFMASDIRVNVDLDALGVLGDAGWYCIRAILWASGYQLPDTAVALRNPKKNEAGVLLSCAAALTWDDGRVATFHCSFLTHITMEISVMGSEGVLNLTDFVIPYEESSAPFSFVSNSGFNNGSLGWIVPPEKHVVSTQLPQEALMVQEFSRLVGEIKSHGFKAEKKWLEISRKTQLVIDAVKASIDNGFEPVQVGN